MNARLRRLAVLILAIAAPAAFARVISYAPYTSQISIPSYHLRTARYFALIEGHAGQTPHLGGQVVLYDSTGGEEPRVIYPPTTAETTINFLAIHEPQQGAAQILLQAQEQVQGQWMRVFRFSNDAGRTWTHIKEFDHQNPMYNSDADFGGPYSHGLAAPVVIGGTYPFVLSLNSGIHAIGADGKPKVLIASDSNGTSWQLAGRDKQGTKYLVRSSLGKLAILDGAGGTTPVGDIEWWAAATGWITPSGAVYIQINTSGGKPLYLYRNQQRQLINDSHDPGNHNEPLGAFAVPTSNYDGAWMIKRGTGKPTALARHTVATGTETFWSDVSGPQVEALHTGDDPNKLLIQVHRPRQQPERWFIDPALAVWTAGQPAPRRYDELFLNETPAKGFLHLDVDLVAQGAPFVFDSGAPASFQDCIVCSPGGGGAGGGGDVVQEWGVVRASLKQRLVLPGVARQAGAFNSYWLTDLVIHNPFDEPQDVHFRFVPMGEVQAAIVIEKNVTLAPREIRVVADVLKSLFALESGGGALHIEPAVAVTATARTYTRNEKGTYGFGMPAIDAFNAASPRFPVTFAGAFPGPEYRTNMILTDTSGRGSEARLLAHGISGRMGVDTVSFTAPVNGLLQMNGLAGMLGVGGDAGGLFVQPTRGTAIATVVAMDNRTNDPTYFPPDLPAPMIRTIPVIGHTSGAHNSQFRSDLYLLNNGTSPRTVRLEAKLWDVSATPKQVLFTLLPGEARVIRDALSTLFGMEGVARLRFGSVDGTDGVRVTSRTYNVDENGGTYGCLIPPLNNFQSAASGETLEILGIVGGTGFRTNLGLVELTPAFNHQNAEARITIVDDTGKTLDSFEIAVATASGTQINDLFGARGIAQPKAAIVYIEVTRGIIGAYATLTDNATNDSTYLGANLAAEPN